MLGRSIMKLLYQLWQSFEIYIDKKIDHMIFIHFRKSFDVFRVTKWSIFERKNIHVIGILT